MAEIATVARPYAEATFKAALEKGALGAVGDSLQLLVVRQSLVFFGRGQR